MTDQSQQTENPTYRPSITECAQTGRPFIEIPYNPDGALRKLLVYLCETYTSPMDLKRIELLCFYTDYRYYQMHGEQLTSCRYTPGMNGMLSDDIHRELQADDAPFNEGRTTRDGAFVSSFSLSSNASDDIDSDLLEFFEQINEETRTVNTDNLQAFSRNVPMYDRTDYDEIAEFTDDTADSMDAYHI